MNQVKTNIAAARRAKGHTQQSLARELGLAPRTVQCWELGETTPTRRNLEALSRALEREPAWFYMVHEDAA